MGLQFLGASLCWYPHELGPQVLLSVITPSVLSAEVSPRPFHQLPVDSSFQRLFVFLDELLLRGVRAGTCCSGKDEEEEEKYTATSYCCIWRFHFSLWLKSPLFFQGRQHKFTTSLFWLVHAKVADESAKERRCECGDLFFFWMQPHLLRQSRPGQSSKVWKVPGGETVCWSLESLSPAWTPPAPLSLARAPSSWLPLHTCQVAPLCTAWLPDWLPRCLAELCGAPDWRESGKGRSGWATGEGQVEGGQSRIPNQSKRRCQCVKTKLDLSANESEEGLNKSSFNGLLRRRCCRSVFLAAAVREAELLKRLAVTTLTPSLCD